MNGSNTALVVIDIMNGCSGISALWNEVTGFSPWRFTFGRMRTITRLFVYGIIKSMEEPTSPNLMGVSVPQKVPTGSKAIAVLFYLVSISYIVLGILSIFGLGFIASVVGSLGSGSGLIFSVIAMIAWGILSFFAGRGLWSGRQWGRVLAITMSALYIAFGFIDLVRFGGLGIGYISLAVYVVIILYLLISKNIRATFQSGTAASTAIILVILAIVVYAAIEYPTLASQQNQALYPSTSSAGTSAVTGSTGSPSIANNPSPSNPVPTPVSAGGIPTLSIQSQDSRDTQRLSDLRTVEGELESYYNQRGVYPNATTWSAMAAELVQENIGVSQVPNDPSSGVTYYYSVEDDGANYVIGAHLEDGLHAVLLLVNYVPPSAGVPNGMKDCLASSQNYCFSFGQ
jgi:hypothetical protein